MNLLSAIERRMVDDWRNVMKWRSAQFVTGGAVFSAFAFALSLSSAGMQFIGVAGMRLAILICVVIFVSAFIGRVWKQKPKNLEQDDNSEHA